VDKSCKCNNVISIAESLPNFGLKNTIFAIAKDFHGKKKTQIHQISKEKIKIKSPEGSQEYRRILFFPTFISSI
jgi:hypothetical protein